MNARTQGNYKGLRAWEFYLLNVWAQIEFTKKNIFGIPEAIDISLLCKKALIQFFHH